TAGATIDVSLGFPLSNAGGAFLDDVPGHVTQIALGLNIDGQNVNLGVNVGPIGIAIEQGSVVLNDGSSDPTKQAMFTVGLTGTSNGQLPLASFSPGDLTASVTGGANISLPLYTGATSSGGTETGGTLLGGQPLTIAIASLPDFFSNPGGITITPDPTALFSSLFANLGVMNLLQNPGDFVGGIDGVLNSLQAALDSGVFSMNLPLIGDKLAGAAQFLSPIVGEADSALNELESLLQGDTASEVVSDLQDALYLIFGPKQTDANWWTGAPFDTMFAAASGSVQQTIAQIAQQLNVGLGLLQDPPDPASVVSVDFYDANGHNLGGLSGGNFPTGTDAIQFDLQLGGTFMAPTVPLDASLGLPGLGLSTSGTVEVSLPWSFNLGFGLSVSDGFYLATSPPSAPVTSASPGTFQIGADVTTPGLQLNGTLGFLSVSATDCTAAGHTQIAGNFAVSLLDPNGDDKNRLPLNDLLAGPDLSSVLSATFTAMAGIHLHLTTSFGNDADFPSLGAYLDIAWDFSSANTDPGNTSDDGSAPTVAFNNVTLDLGSFFSSFVSPILQEIKQVITPVEPVLDILTARIPVISDLEGHDVSLLDIAALFGDVNQSDADAFTNVYQELKQLINLDLSGTGQVSIPLGSFNLGGQDVRNTGTYNPENQQLATAQQVSDAINASGNSAVSGEYQSFSSALQTNPGNISFPLLEDPTKAFGLLMGKSVDLVDITLPSLSGSFSYTQDFPIFPFLVATLTGRVSVTLGGSFGYDTTGLQEFVKDHKPADLLDGFFVGAGKPLVTLQGEILAGAAVSVAVAQAGVEGGLVLTTSLSLVDPYNTGKLHYNDMLKITNDWQMPSCIFEITGSLDFQLDAYVSVLGATASFVVGDVNLATFGLSCTGYPVLATPEAHGVLQLNMGSHAYQRKYGDINDDDENFEVSHVGGTAGDETVQVKYTNSTAGSPYYFTYRDVSEIVADGGAGNNTLTIDPGVLVPVHVSMTDGGPGNNTVTDG
ncbi:MAG: hypothetical protein ACREHD_24995, partial [Pirellulales bacterium]